MAPTIQILSNLSPWFIIGGNFNDKHTAWGSRLITSEKGNINITNRSYHSEREFTYWLTDNNAGARPAGFLHLERYLDISSLNRNLCVRIFDQTLVILITVPMDVKILKKT